MCTPLERFCIERSGYYFKSIIQAYGNNLITLSEYDELVELAKISYLRGVAVQCGEIKE